jgi:two-component system, OmpR family, alkaline phosphatase synthesis response regulator PhoP
MNINSSEEKKKILIVDDEEDLCEILSFNLTKAGFLTDTANSAEEAYIKLKNDYDILLLDVMMGAISGFNLAKIIREDYSVDVPIIFITAKDREDDKLKGFGLGADDYISKPFSIKEVIARVNAVLNRSKNLKKKNNEKSSQILFSERLRINLQDKKVIADNKEIKLTRKEFEILAMLSEFPGKIHSRSEILDKIWNEESYVLDRTIDVHIARLRKKLGPLGQLIKNRSGYGYCIENDEQ